MAGGVSSLRYLLASQVKVRTWMDGIEATELVGVSARFGETISHSALEINALPLAVPSPANSCNTSVLPVSHSTPWHAAPCFCGALSNLGSRGALEETI